MDEDRNDEVIGKLSDGNIIWEVWAAGPLTDDAVLVIRWSRSSFFAGAPSTRPNIIEGKDFSLYHRCKDEAWARERFTHARQYFQEVRLMVNGKQIEVAHSPNDRPKPEEDMLGNCPKLGSLGGC